MHQKNILFFLNKIGSGGSEQYLYLLAKHALKNNNKVTFISNGGNKKEYLEDIGAKVINLPMITIGKDNISDLSIKQRIFLKFYLLIKYLYIFYLYISIGKPDVIISQHGFPTIIAQHVANFFKIKNYNLVHHILPNEYTDIYKQLSLEPYIHIAVSEEIRDFLYAKNIKNCYVLPNPIDFDLITPIFLDAKNKNFTKKNITIVSHIHEDKAENLLAISAISKMPRFLDCKFNICGDFNNEWGYDYYNKNNGNLNFLGNLSTLDLYKMISSSDVILGVGRCAMESLALGKNTIISGHVRGVNGGNYSGVVKPEMLDRIAYYNYSGRSESLVVSIDKLEKDIASLIYEKIDNKAIVDYIKNKHDSEVIYNTLVDIIKNG
ncbi:MULTISPECIES: glycosyltransferase [unclassified Providencia]|uniref:glycosyltransferase n=1 Tax=unclassified Providencia TaxID=2633465 RepID=UPI00228DBA03|nr:MULTISPECIES: glycosyltransferase [unclassified Providencia]HCT9038698.1 glycosyltransferase [Providencia rettgeri]